MLEVVQYPTPAGDLGVLELGDLAPFPVKRVYWLQNTPPGTTRGLHAHKTLQQVFIALRGSLTISLDDGEQTRIHHVSPLTPPLLVSPVTWRTLSDFTPDSLLMVLASEHYDAADYIHDYEEFRAWLRR